MVNVIKMCFQTVLRHLRFYVEWNVTGKLNFCKLSSIPTDSEWLRVHMRGVGQMVMTKPHICNGGFVYPAHRAATSSFGISHFDIGIATFYTIKSM